MPQIKLISLNVEGNRHWGRIMPFLRAEKPDVLCCQEIFDLDIPKLTQEFGFDFIHAPITRKPYSGAGKNLKKGLEGVALFSRFPLKNKGVKYYYSPSKTFLDANLRTVKTKRETIHHALIWALVEKEGMDFNFATTHFSWTADGLISEFQRTDLEKLLEIAGDLQPHVLTGDFNAPRGFNEIYDILTKRYTDAVPKEIKSSIDLNIHRRASDPKSRERLSRYMVDYIFTMPPFKALNVRLAEGVSDHKALIADIQKN